MQAIRNTYVKANEVRAAETPDTPPPLAPPLPPEEEAAAAERVSGFMGVDDNPASTPEIPSNTFDLLFSGTSGGAGTVGAGPSLEQFSPLNVPTVQDWLIINPPESRNFLDRFILKMESIRDKRFVPEKQRLTQIIKDGGMTPNETVVVQKRIMQLDAVILKINQEVQNAKHFQKANVETFEQEKIHMKDLNNDGYVGDPSDKENSYLIGHYPNGKEVLLNPTTHKPAINPYLDPNYMPAVADLDHMTLLDKAAQETKKADGTIVPNKGKLAADAYLQIPDLKEHPPLMEFAATEGFWVRKDKNGKPKFDKDGSYSLKPLEMVTREDGKKMLGQTPPAEGDKDKWMFVAATDLEIFSNKNTNGAGGGDVFLEFQDKGIVLARIRVEGRETNEESPMTSGRVGSNYYIAATTLGVVINGGDGKHSTRIRPMNVDASELHSTGVVQLSTGNLPEIGKKADALMTKIDELQTLIGHLRGNPNNMNSVEIPRDSEFWSKRDSISQLFGELQRLIAGNEQLPKADRDKLTANIYQAREYFFKFYNETYNGFTGLWTTGNLTSANNVLRVIKNFNHEGRLASTVIQDNIRSAKSATAFMETGQLDDFLKPASTRYSDSDEEGELRFGIAVSGIRGVITGTNNSDIIVVPPPDDEHIRELLPVGTEEIDPSHAAYGTYVDAKEGGNNVVISKGGDLYANGVTFLWREAMEGKTGDHISVKTNNATEKDNHKIFVHIDDPHPDWVKIYNGEDGTTDGEKAAGGIKDDVYEEVPENAMFSMKQNDIPGGMSLKRIDEGLGDVITNDQSASKKKILDEAINADPLAALEGAGIAEPEYGAAYDEWEKTADSFFGEWEFFKESTDGVDPDADDAAIPPPADEETNV